MSSLKKYMKLIRVIGTSSFLITHVKTLPLNCFVRERLDLDRYPTKIMKSVGVEKREQIRLS